MGITLGKLMVKERTIEISDSYSIFIQVKKCPLQVATFYSIRLENPQYFQWVLNFK